MSKNGPEKSCFVVSPIGEANSETRRKADEVFNYIIKPIVSELGYSPVRADTIDQSGFITTQIIQRLVSADLVIADLSERNPNVFYELSVRHASRKPFVQLITAGEPIPFDVAANRTIQYDLTRLGVSESAKAQLRAQILAIEGGNDEIENPISAAVDLSLLRASSAPADRVMADVLATLTEVGAAVARIDNTINPGGASSQVPRNKLESQLARARGQLSELRDEVGRLRLVKNKIDLEQLTEPWKVDAVLKSMASVLEDINKHAAIFWTDSQAEAVVGLLDRLAKEMRSEADDIVPF